MSLRSPSLRRGLAAAACTIAAAATIVVGTPAAAAPADVSPLAIRQVVSGLNQAWAIDFLPDGTPLFTERNSAKIRRIEGRTAVDVQRIPGVAVTREGGLLGLAVSPNYAQDQTVFIYYTTSRDNRVAKLRLGQSPQPIVTGIPRGRQNHQGGRIRFGPDGYLYIGTGDAENANSAQNRDSLAGKVLRVDTNGAAAPGNPFGNRVYSYGHRNVQGLAWVGNQLYITDIGPSDVDELNRIEAGRNYGWPRCSGPCNIAGMTNPVKSWPTSYATPSGMAYYRGMLYIASLKGGTIKVDTSGNGGKIYTAQGRTRDEVAGPDGQLWVVTPSAIYAADGT
ncbi:Glucose/arabinose dehydrogenase, beta-propeller fold [Amycolatopsis arida]|uniref:Glucose/arabinose dehydrogenase, beta-propeller fold n=1 Tax=Amycolatopsis arida TaxID=587909 RepID=A0A1I5LDC5_9PSEU|nr:PQQ-dependent sugar dehydrogenase [Amycolatopsis arida]TDX93677.1 glucose/arabinose dehydrogenase [Amycolatopsis arida]SFO95173.1 Glucose/arabinose dehydrogenase, beta-propeller fold [Amycolatopsis arida]